MCLILQMPMICLPRQLLGTVSNSGISEQTGQYSRIISVAKLYEPPHDNVRPAKTQISLAVRPVRSVFAVRMKNLGSRLI